MKYKLSQAEYDALSDAIKALYKAQDGAFVLIVEGLPTSEEAAELKRAQDRVKEEKRILAEENRTLKEKLDLVSNDDARKRGDIEALEKSWKEKLTAAENAGNQSASVLKAKMQNLLVNDVASAMAAKLAGKSAALLLPHIKARLRAEFDGEDAITRVIDANGKASALSVAELEKEFATNEAFAAIIIASNASGGGANGNNKGGGATKKLSEMNADERIAFREADPEGFKKQSKAYNPF